MKAAGKPARAPAGRVGEQVRAIFEAWGAPPAEAGTVAAALGWADLRGIDSHGIAMLPTYDEWRLAGRLNLRPHLRTERDSPVSALLDGDAGPGHVVGLAATKMGIAKAQQTGIAAIAVRNSSHLGALGFYAGIAAEAGLICLITSTTQGVRVAPTGGAEARLGTEPIAFAAPGAPDEPFLLDMATTTAAYGKIRNKAYEGLPAPPGWALTSEGAPSTDPLDVVERGGFLAPLGGSAESGSYKGYGLAVMAGILASCLPGAILVTDPKHRENHGPIDVGHFFLLLDPGLFRDAADFRSDVGALCASLRATRPRDPKAPVMVAGDPERAVAAKRSREGVPIQPGLRARLKQIAAGCGADWLLDT